MSSRPAAPVRACTRPRSRCSKCDGRASGWFVVPIGANRAGVRQARCRSFATFGPCALHRQQAATRTGWRMKIDVLSVGSFPEATNAELASRFAVTHHFNRPRPDALSGELKRRVRAIAPEANRGADRALIAALPKLEVISVFGVGTDSVDLDAARE